MRRARRGRTSFEEGAAIALLRRRLLDLAPGEIRESAFVAALLADCWHEFEGSTAQRMQAGKLGRMEDVRWDPPVLSFTVERHGAMSMGSTRAELKHWLVDIDRRTARCERNRSYRQALPRAEAVKTEPIARELADIIVAEGGDPRLKWLGDGTVRILMARIFPYDSGYMQTVSGRRKRLRAALEALLSESGWRAVRQDVYSRAGNGGTQA
jgi:hypothetical protein